MVEKDELSSSWRECSPNVDKMSLMWNVDARADDKEEEGLFIGRGGEDAALGDDNFLERARLSVHGVGLDLADHIHTFENATKHYVLTIEP